MCHLIRTYGALSLFLKARLWAKDRGTSATVEVRRVLFLELLPQGILHPSDAKAKQKKRRKKKVQADEQKPMVDLTEL